MQGSLEHIPPPPPIEEYVYRLVMKLTSTERQQLIQLIRAGRNNTTGLGEYTDSSRLADSILTLLGVRP